MGALYLRRSKGNVIGSAVSIYDRVCRAVSRSAVNSVVCSQQGIGCVRRVRYGS